MTSTFPNVPAEIGPYLAQFRVTCEATLDGSGVYVTGSIALDDFQFATSDIDVLVVTTGPTPHSRLEQFADTVAALSLPARGLECVVYPFDAVACPAAPPRWQLNLDVGPRLAAPHVGFDPLAEPGFWFVLDLALARSSAIPLVGPSAADVIGEVPAARIAAALRAGLHWHATNEPASANRVLGLCRVWRWTENRTFVSKSAAADWAFRRVRDPLIREALRIRATGEGTLLQEDVARFVDAHVPEIEAQLANVEN
jgi:hypothetical protein